MVLLGEAFWNPRAPRASGKGPAPKPVYPLLKALSKQAVTPFEGALLVCDDADEIVRFIKSFGVRRREKAAAKRQHKMGRNALVM